MELYMQNREHGRMIFESVEHGPLIWPTVEENGVIGTKKYAELSVAEKIQADCDMKATNIILQGLPSDVYSLVNHHRVSKDLWERVQLLMQEVVAQESAVTKVYTRRPKVVQIVLWYLDSGCSKHITEDRSQLTNFVHKFLGTVKFGNDQIAKIIGYGDYQIGNITISRVYYMEGLRHSLFSVGQFYDSNLKVAFRKHTCFVRNLEGDDLLSGSRETNLYTFSMGDMMASSPICLLSITIICLATNKRFDFSKLIFDGIVKNLENKYKFLMYLRFLQMILNKDTRLNTFYKRLYIAPVLTQKVFSNMKKESRGFSRVEIALFPTILVSEHVSQGGGPTSPVGTQHTPTIIESSLHLQNISITYMKTRTRTGRMGIRIPQSNVPSSDLDETITKELHDGLGRATTTASSLAAERAVKLEKKLNHKRRRAVISSEEEETSLDHEDSPKHGRMIEEINKDENVNLVQSSEQGEAQETAKHRMEFSIASPQIDDDETLAETLLNIKRSAAKDKGKANMQESESPKKIKKKEIMHISFDEEISQRLYEEEQVQILRDEEYAQQVQAQ
nr:integrase, catalytic region, zinc finger, CCHC-type, peptidase aspartic, catalytic [Tanacetum cinerariifolium]